MIDYEWHLSGLNSMCVKASDSQCNTHNAKLLIHSNVDDGRTRSVRGLNRKRKSVVCILYKALFITRTKYVLLSLTRGT